MKNTIAKVSAKRDAPTAKKIAHSFHVTRAANGYTSETHFKGDMEGDGPMYMQPELNVHKSLNEAARHMKMKLGEGPGKDGTAKHEKAESKGYEKKEEAEGDDD